MTPFENKQVESVFETYDEKPRMKLLALRELIFDTSNRMDDICLVEETLKWGEPSYLTPQGSTVRIGWKDSDPDNCRLYFHCQTSLVPTFRELYPDLDYEDNRAIRFPINDILNTKQLGNCIELALVYHSVKHLPNLGVKLQPTRSSKPNSFNPEISDLTNPN